MNEATIAKKAELVEVVTERFQSSASAVIVDCIGLTVAEVSELRNNLYKEGIELKVIKNNILRRAASKCGYDSLLETFSGPSAVAFSKDATNASKIIFDFAKNNDKLKIKGGVVEGEVYGVKELKVISSLPNKEGMLSMLLSVLQAPIRNLACVVKAVADKDEAQEA